MRILHVFSDEKFIDRHIKIYEGSGLINSFVLLKKNHSYEGKYKEEIVHIYPGNERYKRICEDKHTYNAIVVYFLDEYKIRLINDLKNPKTKILWSFYGAEIYSLPSLKYQFLSRDTQRLLGHIKFGIHIQRIKQRLKKIINKIARRPSFEDKLRQVSGTIDYFLWYNKHEYDFLNAKLGFILPPFFQAVLSDNIGKLTPRPRQRSKIIMLGNSRSPYNNHIDILRVLKDTQFRSKTIIPFGYGTKNKYGKKLQAVVQKKQIASTFIEDFVTFKEYVDIVNGCTAVIFNSYRQMALGNILIAVRFGIKIYLNIKNPIYDWLISLGFIVFSVQHDLKHDLINENLALDEESVMNNKRLYFKITDKALSQEFIKRIKQI